MIPNTLEIMFQALTRHRKAHKALDSQVLRIKAVRLSEVEPTEIPISFTVTNNWKRINQELGYGVMFARTSYKRDDEIAISSHWEERAMMHPHVHPDSDEYIYLVRGALRDHSRGITIRPGEQVSEEDVLAGKVSAQPYIIPAGTAHFLQALEPDTFFVTKFKPANVNPDNSQ